MTSQQAGGDPRLGWDRRLDEALATVAPGRHCGRVARLDRGWSSVLYEADGEPVRVRNIGADVAVGDWVVISDDGERVEHVVPRHSGFTRRASFEGSRAVAHTIAANIDVVVLVHALTSPPNQRRLERELVLAFDSGASPAIVLTKRDLVDDPAASIAALEAVAAGVPVLCASGVSGEGQRQRSRAEVASRRHRPDLGPALLALCVAGMVVYGLACVVTGAVDVKRYGKAILSRGRRKA